MRNTASITDKITILICCLILYLFQTDFSISVVILLISIIFSSFLTYFDDSKVRIALTIGFSALSCVVPGLIVFFPLAAYDMVFCKYQYFNLFGIIPLIYVSQASPVPTVIIVMAILVLSVLLKYRTSEQGKLYIKYNDLNDAAREMSIQLKKQNSDLIEKQDYELSVATLNERNRIAREIHDNVGHLLSSAILQSGAILTINQDQKVADSLKTLKDTLNQAMTSIRISVHELYDESIDLHAQITELIHQFAFCELSYDYQLNSNPDKKLKYAFISVIKEALSNIIRHSDATHVSIVLREHPALYQLIIRDNGKVGSYRTDEGMGLKNMADRVEALNGIINIGAKNGFEIFISVPKGGYL